MNLKIINKMTPTLKLHRMTQLNLRIFKIGFLKDILLKIKGIKMKNNKKE